MSPPCVILVGPGCKQTEKPQRGKAPDLAEGQAMLKVWCLPSMCDFLSAMLYPVCLRRSKASQMWNRLPKSELNQQMSAVRHWCFSHLLPGRLEKKIDRCSARASWQMLAVGLGFCLVLKRRSSKNVTPDLKNLGQSKARNWACAPKALGSIR